jgi:hypothetical protein
MASESNPHPKIITLSNPHDLEKNLRKALHRLDPQEQLTVEVSDENTGKEPEMQQILHCFLRRNPSIEVKYNRRGSNW